MPWLTRDEWAHGRIPSSQAVGLVLPWIMTAGFCGVTSAYLGGYGLFQHPGKVLDDPAVLVLTPFVIVSIALLLWTLRNTWRVATSGNSMLELTTIPGVIGGEFKGIIRIPWRLRDGQSVRLILTCDVFSWRDSGSGKSYGSSFTVWQDDREIAASTIVQSNGVPVHFAIPGTPPATVAHEVTGSGWHSVTWMLEARGEPGGFWRGLYEVPVFRTSQSPPAAAPIEPSLANVGAMVGAMMHGTAFAETKGELVERPASTRIQTQFTMRGLEIRLPMRISFVVSSLWVLATLPIWIAPLLVARWLPQVPLGMTVGVSLCAALFFNVLPAYLLVLYEPRRIVVGPREIIVSCGWPLLGLQRRFPMDEFDGIDASRQNFAVLRKNGSFFKRRFYLATRLESNAEARWLASEIEKAVPPAKV